MGEHLHKILLLQSYSHHGQERLHDSKNLKNN